LKNEFDQISDMGPHLFAINIGVRMDLEDDSHADKLRATLMRFNTPMRSASDNITSCFTAGIFFYDHAKPPEDIPAPISREMIGRLLEPDFQARALELARKAVADAAVAANTVRKEVLPQLAQVQKDLEDYVSDYVARDTLRKERGKSWVPSLLLNAIEGPIDPTPWDVGEVKQFPQRFAIASNLLRRLPSFLDNLELHFRRLSEVNSQQMLEYGYNTSDDLVRLYHDRILCRFIFSEIRLSWFSAHRALGIGSLQKIPGQSMKRK
jgi:hypothetical protein